jgi:hypothetical protein
MNLSGENYRHIVICGHDALIEMIAKSWKWISNGAFGED